jgi:hypothetical protein
MFGEIQVAKRSLLHRNEEIAVAIRDRTSKENLLTGHVHLRKLIMEMMTKVRRRALHAELSKPTHFQPIAQGFVTQTMER